MSTLTRDPARTAPAGPTRNNWIPRLGGPVWLVWRQHRAAFWTLIAVTLIGALVMLWLRGQMMDFLAAQDPASRRSGGLPPEFETYVNPLFSIGSYLGYIPVLAGVLLGAPLFAGDLESGTAKLVTSQSVSRLRWLITKLALPAAMLALSTGVLTAVLTWWWDPVKGLSSGLIWTAFFSVTGVTPVAYALLTFTVGAAVGMLLRRTLVSMVVTLGIVGAIGFVWSEVWRKLGHTMSISTDKGVGHGAVPPELPAQAEQQGQGTYFLTDSGGRLDWTTCLDKMDNDRAHTACLESKHVVGWSLDYLPVSQMHTMQWLGAGIMLALSAAVVAFVILWGRKRLL
ncbi:ABC transporter permease [Streptomyces sp. NPDC090052]|uniref:ABC transporter permease n=1 Tax=unclassified Streptomyces TaxID=2593676 RepID=UPI0037FE340F|nr:transmembrane transport protein [Streptomyces sp. NBC_00963]WSX66364.1 transmembrane transport protein [Streptomyces sp. NBC_00932]